LSRFAQKLLAAIIALTTAGAQVVCACPTALASIRPQPAVAKSCTGQKECCRKSELSKPVQPPRQLPCNNCNLKHRAEQAMPDRHDSVLSAHSLLWSSIPLAAPAAADVCPLLPEVVEIFPSPPLLNDLFHIHSLLLI